MSDLSYWEKRKAQNMFEYMEDAEKAADEISKVYMKASSYLSVEAEKIFQKFRSKHNLSEAEARTLINSLIDPTSMEELKRRLAEAPDDSEQAQILAEIESQAYRDRIERMEGMQDQIDAVMQNVYQQEKQISTEHYINLGKESYYRSIYDIQHKTGYAFGFSKVDDKLIRQVINSKWSGQNYSNRIWKNTKELSQDIKKELLVNLLTGRTEREAAEVIANKCAVGSFQARRLVRTESSFLSSQMDMKSYEECEIDYYFFMATLDLRTSEKCRNLDGKRFKVKDQQPGINCPPMHPFCRSTTGCDLRPEDLANMKRRARNPKNGKTELVPGNMTYQQWYEKYVSGEGSSTKSIEKPSKSDIMISGARITDPDSDAGTKFAKMYYQEIRSFSTDSKKIAKNLGKSEEEIQQIKEYLFETGFDPDCAVAQSWQRLMEGKDIKPHDRTLIEHELLEMQIKKEHPEMEHWKAHEIATKKYDYQNEVMVYYGNLEKHRENK